MEVYVNRLKFYGERERDWVALKDKIRNLNSGWEKRTIVTW